MNTEVTWASLICILMIIFVQKRARSRNRTHCEAIGRYSITDLIRSKSEFCFYWKMHKRHSLCLYSMFPHTGSHLPTQFCALLDTETIDKMLYLSMLVCYLYQDKGKRHLECFKKHYLLGHIAHAPGVICVQWWDKLLDLCRSLPSVMWGAFYPFDVWILCSPVGRHKHQSNYT